MEITREQTRSPRQRFIAQITLHAGGAVLRAEERSVDLQNAIDRVAAVIDRQIARFKGKSHDKTRGTSVARTPQTPPKAVDTKKLIRRKRLTVKPMTVNQAIDAMELVGHDFYLFQDSDGEAVNLVYRRQDGNYGLIESQADEE